MAHDWEFWSTWEVAGRHVHPALTVWGLLKPGAVRCRRDALSIVPHSLLMADVPAPCAAWHDGAQFCGLTRKQEQDLLFGGGYVDRRAHPAVPVPRNVAWSPTAWPK